jgi:DNA-binding NtrC family response regulator
MRILIIDDDELTLIALSEKLKAKGRELLTAKDSLKALTMINSENIDLIICDVIMPGVSALSLLSILNRYEAKRIPLIIISYLSSADTIRQSLNLEVLDFFTKPIDYRRLGLLIDKIEKKLVKTILPG